MRFLSNREVIPEGAVIATDEIVLRVVTDHAEFTFLRTIVTVGEETMKFDIAPVKVVRSSKRIKFASFTSWNIRRFKR